MNYEWSLDRIYSSFDSDEFKSDWQKIDTLCDEMAEVVAKAKVQLSPDIASAILAKYEEIYTLIDKTMLYVSLRFEADSNSEENMKMFSLLVAKDSKISPVLTIAMKLLSEGNFYEEAEKTEKLFADYKFMLKTNCESAKHYLSDDSEEMYSLMNMTGGSAWGTMHSALTSSLAVDYDGGTVTLPEIRNLAYSADADVRRRAYEAELAAYKKIEQPIAFALNNIKLQSTNIALKRGYESPLDATLKAQNMSRETLDTMFGEIKKYLPVFHKYLRAKAKLLGYENGLPWYDMFAPIGESSKTYTPEEAGEFLVSVFSSLSPDMARMIEAAFRDGWIDFYPREGKSGGAFCAEAGCLEESRILTNFDGTFSLHWDKSAGMEGLAMDPATGTIYIGLESTSNSGYVVPAPDYNSKTNFDWLVEGAESMDNSGVEGIAWYKGELLMGTQTGATLFRYTLDGKLQEKKSLRTVCPTISEIAGLDYDEENDWLWVIDSNSNSEKPQYDPYTIYLFNGAATKLIAKYYIGDFADWNPEAICVDKKNGCIWIGEDCGDEKFSILHKVKFSGM